MVPVHRRLSGEAHAPRACCGGCSGSRSVHWLLACLLLASGLLAAGCESAVKAPPKPELFAVRNGHYVLLNADDPADSLTGTPPYFPFLVRQSNCSLTREVSDSTETVVNQSANYQDDLHTAEQIPTTPDVFANGCVDPTTGIASESGAIVGKLSNGSTAVANISSDGVQVTIISSQQIVVGTPTDYPILPTGNNLDVIYGIASADVNGDGIPDIVVAGNVFGSAANGVIGVLLGNGDGTFNASTSLSLPGAGSANLGVTLDDVNGDSKLDIVAVASLSSGSGVDVFLNTGSKTAPFPATGITGPSGASGSLAVSAQFTSSGHKDLALSSGQILLGDGTGHYTLQSETLGAGQFAGLTAADYNHDGNLDLAFINNAAETIDVFFGNGNGTFTYSASYPSVPGSANIDSTDLDGDGHPDIFVGTAHSGVFTSDTNTGGYFFSPLNYGNGTFGPSRSYLPSNYLMRHFTNNSNAAFALNDFNGDGKPDMVTADFSSSGPFLSVLTGNGDGTFNPSTVGTQTSITGPTAPIQIDSLAAASLRKNTTNDVIFSWTDGSGNGHISVALGNANGTFQTQTDYSVPGSGNGVLNPVFAFGNGSANGLVLADVNGDGYPDIVFLSAPGAIPNSTTDLYVMLNNKNGTFGSPTLADSEAYLSYLAASDLTGANNGQDDLVVTAGNSSVQGTAYLYLNKVNGTGAFNAPANIPQGSYYVSALAIADVNGDGKPDLIFAGENQNLMGGNLTILLGNGNGTFQTGISTAHPIFFPSGIVTGLFTGSSHADVALGGESPYILPGNGDGTFQTANAGYLSLPFNPVYLQALDVNGNGPSLFAASSNGTPLAITVLVPSAISVSGMTATTTALRASSTSVTSGQSVTFTATVTPQSGSGVPTGTVNFLNGATSIGGGTLNGSGVATLTTSSLAAGTHSITASYGGDANFAGSVSAPALTESVADFSITVTPLNPTNSTINAGQSATYTITVTPLGGFTGTVNLSCSNAPSAATCAPNVPSVTPSAANPVTATLTVTTTARGQIPDSQRHHFPPPAGTLPLPNLILAILLAIACAAFAARRRRGRFAATAALLVLVLLSGCSSSSGSGSSGGNGSGGSTSSGTPANSYSLTITGQSGSLSHNATASLKVN